MDKNCNECNGSGVSNAWVSNDGDYDFEWCDCNPNHLTPDMIQDDTCIGCNENKISWDELYCLNCYVEKNSEIDYTQIDQLWLTAEAN